MWEVTGQVVSRRPVSVASMPLSESASRIASGTWQDALTIASKPVRATDTRKPARRSCASRRSREASLPSAMRTCGTPRADARDRTAGDRSVGDSDVGPPFSRIARRGARTLPLDVRGGRAGSGGREAGEGENG